MCSVIITYLITYYTTQVKQYTLVLNEQDAKVFVNDVQRHDWSQGQGIKSVSIKSVVNKPSFNCITDRAEFTE